MTASLMHQLVRRAVQKMQRLTVLRALGKCLSKAAKQAGWMFNFPDSVDESA